MIAEELARRLITLIFAGRNRMDMIRRELPRTKRAGCGRIKRREGSPFRGALNYHRLFCPGNHLVFWLGCLCQFLLLFGI
jgi:hypothetical protein